MTHGTLNCDDKATSDRLVEGVLGLKIIVRGRSLAYLAHPDTPWYIVVLPTARRDYLSPSSRFTLEVASAGEVMEAHREFSSNGKDLGVMHYWDLKEENGRTFFIFSDINRNWWELTS